MKQWKNASNVESRKVNYATDLRIAFTNGLNKYLAENPDTIDPKKYSAAGREEVKKYVMSK